MITVIGSINLDLITTVGRLPRPGETISGKEFRSAPGGKGANQALAAARAGAKVRMIGAVGDDAFAGEALTLLADGGVDLSGVATTDRATGTALIMVEDSGENMIAVAPGANRLVDAGRVASLSFSEDEIVLMQQEIPPETIRAAVEKARAAGARSILNIAPWRAEATPVVTLPDIVVANETEFDEASAALGLPPQDRDLRMREFAGRTGRTVIVTLGADGVLAADSGGIAKVPALNVKPVDTVGAGDTFCGYLAASLQRGDTLQNALKRAATAASLACLKPGAQPAIPMAEEVEARL